MQPKSLALMAFVAVFLAGVGLFLLSGPDRSSNDPDAQRTADERGTSDHESVSLAGTEGSGPRATATRTNASGQPKGPATWNGEHPWEAQLAQIKGRLIEADGSPAGGLTVDLLGATVVAVLGEGHQPLPSDGLLVGSATSGEDGRFSFDGVLGEGFHGLSIDSGGPRATFRVVEQTPVFGEVTDLGDITLEPYGTVVGTVIDEDGDPVAGARVRFAIVPDFIMGSGALDVREDTAIWAGEGAGEIVLDFAKRVTDLIERLPVSTGTTDAEGVFRVEGVPLGLVAGGVDRDGHVGSVIPQFELRAGEHDVGEVELLFGREITARVSTTSGEPVENADVMIGVKHPVLPVGFLQPALPLDSVGEARVAHLPEDGTPIAIARRTDSEDWTSATATSGDHVDVTLKDAPPLLVRVQDDGGSPLSGAVIGAVPASGGFFDLSRNMRSILSDEPVALESEEVEPGLYAIDHLTVGLWTVRAEVPGYGFGTADHEHTGAGESTMTIACQAAQELRVHVTDASTGSALENVHVVLMNMDVSDRRALGSGWSDAAGMAQLELLQAPKERVALPNVWMPGNRGYLLLCTHPRFGRKSTTVRDFEQTVNVALEPPASLSGHVTWNGLPPGVRYMVVLVGGNEADRTISEPRFALTDSDGHYRVGGLGAGTYEFVLFERFLGESPLAFVGELNEPQEVAESKIVIEAGEAKSYDVTLDEAGAAKPGWFEGRVLLNGQPLPGATLSFDGNSGLITAVDASGEAENVVNAEPPDPNAQFVTDASGFYRSPVFESGGYIGIEVSIDDVDEAGQPTKVQIVHEYESAPTGGPAQLDFDVFSETVKLEVVHAKTRAPIGGVRIIAYNNVELENTVTDASGHLESTFYRSETDVTLATSMDGFVDRTIRLSFPQSNPAAFTVVELEPTVECSGRVLAPPSDDPHGMHMIVVNAAGAPAYTGQWIRTERSSAGELTFDAPNLVPGEYTARLNSPEASKSVTFTVPENGTTSLVLDFSE